MCGRFSLGGDPDRYGGFLQVARTVGEALEPNWNVAPTDPVYVVAEQAGERVLGTMRWGLVPRFSTDPRTIHINARAETLAAKPAFRDSLRRRRCIVPADGFFEWEPKEQGRTPHWVYRADGYPMAFAGLWASWSDPIGEHTLRTCAIVTTAAAGVVAAVHDRMPVVLVPGVWDAWLDRDLTDVREAVALLQTIDTDLVMAHPVSSRVNSVRNNDPDLRLPAGGPGTLPLGEG